jgi:outer membrane lipoprotein-sorting protein
MDELIRYLQTIFVTLIIFCNVNVSAENTKPAPDVDDTIAIINQATQNMSTFNAKFKQIKRFRILTNPMVIDGMIYINRTPFKLAWHIQKPISYSVIISDDRLLQWDNDSARAKEYIFSDNPVLGMISKTYHDILLGDFSRIAKECEISVDKRSNAINVTPFPNSNMSKAITKIIFVFNEKFQHLTSISIAEPGGNSTIIDFTDIRINDTIPDKAWMIGNESRF